MSSSWLDMCDVRVVCESGTREEVGVGIVTWDETTKKMNKNRREERTTG